MSSRRCFKAKHTVKVVSFKDGKVNRRSKLSVPIKYSERTNVHKYTSSSLPETSACGQPEVSFGGDEIVGPSFKPKRGKMRLKKKIKAYRDRKIKLGNAWLGIRQQLFSAFLEHQAMPVNQGCVIPECKESACGRCLDCGPAHFMCEEHINLVHASGQSFHYPEIWEIEKYIQYKFKEVVVWETNHNLDHGYTRDVVVVNRNGQQRLVKFKFCCHEPEAVTLMKYGLWPSSPKEPQAAFEKNLMELVKYIFLECRTSLKSICQAIYWIMPSLSPVYPWHCWKEGKHLYLIPMLFF
ncbi:uncharacterized protein LOC114530178 isoform X2 [Dendronephthya gigantea]|uniref:uncharacterized protein LOC114530178 isoform X2 n=1 Tax=Dendronephthya gigantea TaxID=151771 RepID=UPI001069B7B7|nr:uncharacterized protein LOC114530178 isoform X2 [Dendronephthya gigantea]